MTARLPIIGQDDGVWGQILNEYLLVSHNADGTEKNTGGTAGPVYTAPSIFIPASRSEPDSVDVFGDGSLNLAATSGQAQQIVLTRFLASNPDNDGSPSMLNSNGVQYYDHLGNSMGYIYSDLEYDGATGELTGQGFSANGNSSNSILTGKNVSDLEGAIEFGVLYIDGGGIWLEDPILDAHQIAQTGPSASDFTQDFIHYAGQNDHAPIGSETTYASGKSSGFRVDNLGQVYAPAYLDLDGNAVTGGGLPAWFQSGDGSPAGSITPAQQGAVYFDTTNGAEYIAVGATDSDWISVGGNNVNQNPDIPGVQTDNNGFVSITSGNNQYVYVGDNNGYWGTFNGFQWNPNGNSDGSQTAILQLGDSGQYTHTWAADGSYTMPSTQLHGLADPTDDQDAATKAYVDTQSGGGSLPSWFQSGSGSPLPDDLNITPVQQGALYQDLTGGLYLAGASTSSDWVGVGGATDFNSVGFGTAGGNLYLRTTNGQAVIISDIDATNGGTANGIKWEAPSDGMQSAVIQLGDSGQFTHDWGSDGTYNVPGTNIKGLADPIDDQDAATKNYVDTQSGGGGGLPIWIETNDSPNVFSVAGSVGIGPPDTDADLLTLEGGNNTFGKLLRLVNIDGGSVSQDLFSVSHTGAVTISPSDNSNPLTITPHTLGNTSIEANGVIEARYGLDVSPSADVFGITAQARLGGSKGIMWLFDETGNATFRVEHGGNLIINPATGNPLTVNGLATSDPHAAGAFWNNGGVVNVSAG